MLVISESYQGAVCNHRPSLVTTHRKIEKERQLADGRGGRGWARSRIIGPQESLVLYKSFNALWKNQPYHYGQLLATPLFQLPSRTALLKVHKHEIFLNTIFAETETIWSQGPVTRDF